MRLTAVPLHPEKGPWFLAPTITPASRSHPRTPAAGRGLLPVGGAAFYQM